MVAKGYSNQYLVADALGTHDGVVPVLMIDTLLEAAENWIDQRIGRGWLNTTVTSEPHVLTGDYPMIWLRQTPVVALTAVTARTLWVGSDVQTLPITAYELLDATRGKVLVSGQYGYAQLAVSYTTSAPVPADITLASTLLVASWVRPMIGSASSSTTSGMDPIQLRAQGIKSYTIGQDLAVTFQDSTDKAITLAAPIEVLRIVDQYRTIVFA